MQSHMIPVASPRFEYEAYREELDEAIKKVLNSGSYILGPEVSAFEKEFADYVGVPYCIGVGNGTDAIAIALRAVGIKAGDEVITVSHSAVATVAAVEQIGAVPVLADIDPLSRCMNPLCLESLISERSKAILPVHIYGQPADIQQIVAVAKKHNLKVVEDCAQAHGAMVAKSRIGSFGDAAAFSFYPTKNLGAIGDGGAVLSSFSAVAEKARLLQQYGWKERYVSEIVGFNSRLDEVQAAILRVKLRHLDYRNERREEIARYYSQALRQSECIQEPPSVNGTRPVFHQYVIRCGTRDDFRSHMQQKGIATALHYPLAIHQQPAYMGRLKGWHNLSETEALYRELVSLPMFPDLTDREIEQVAEALQSYKAVMPEK